MEEERSYVGWIAGGAIVVAVAAFIGYNLWQKRAAEGPATAPPAEAPATAPAPATATTPPIQHPLPTTETETEPLPPLAQSDALLTDALTRLLGKKSLGEYMHVDGIVRRIVATIDNLPRARVSSKIMIAKPVPGQFLVDRQGDDTVLAPSNAERYSRYVQLMDSIDSKRAVAVYLRLYPLFQRAYEELGYPNAYFNDRLIQVIDDLLAAPDVQGPIKLMQPKVRYEYADPGLESLSAGQKIMLRMGADNAARVKAKLRELRGELTSLPKQQPAATPTY